MGYIAARTEIVSVENTKGVKIDMQMDLKVLEVIGLIAHLAAETEKGLPLKDRVEFRSDLLESINARRNEVFK